MRGMLLSFLLLLTVGCGAREPAAELNMADEPRPEAPPADVAIRIIRTACYGSCPTYTLLVFSNGKVVFKGDRHVRVAEATGQIDPATVRNLVSAFARDGFRNLEPYYSSGHTACGPYRTDQSGTITTVRFGSTSKTVYYNRGCQPSSQLQRLAALEDEVEAAARTAAWVGGRRPDSHKPESSITRGVLPVKPGSSATSEGPFRVSGGVQAPIATHRVEPDFSNCKDKYSGYPSAEAVIRANGSVHDVKILRPVNPCVDKAVVSALRQWTFKPGTLDGRPVDVIYDVTVHINYR
jgi:hypothetical protein